MESESESSLTPIWGDEAWVFQWGDFSAPEKVRLRDLHAQWGIVLAEPDPTYAIASKALDWFTKHFAALQDEQLVDPRVRIIACFVVSDELPGCNAIAFPLSGKHALGCEQPTYAIHVNLEAVPVLVNQSRRVVGIFERELLPGESRNLDERQGKGNAALAALMFVLYHELAHILRGHLEWVPALNLPFNDLSKEARRERKALEIDADFFAVGYGGDFIRQFFAEKDASDVMTHQFTQGWFAVMSLYSMFSSLNEATLPGEDRSGCYYSAMSRLTVVVYRLTETMNLDGTLGANLVALLTNGFKAAMHDDPSLARILDFNPDFHEKEFAELIEHTVPKLVELQERGRLKGWLT